MQDKSELSTYTMFQGPGVQRENNIIQWLKHLVSRGLKDLSGGWHYPHFEQLGPRPFS